MGSHSKNLPNSATRKPDEFDRKLLSEIAKGTDSRLVAVRLAPPEMNGQPWCFIVDGSDIHAYYKPSLGGLKGKLYHFTDLDLGLALCHLDVASEHDGKPFSFKTERKDAPNAPQGFTYVGTQNLRRTLCFIELLRGVIVYRPPVNH